jgi:hypothetical protein
MTDLKIRHGIVLIQTTDLHKYPGGDDRLPLERRTTSAASWR